MKTMKIKLINNIRDYIQGTLRYNLYYSRLKFLLAPHIVEQFKWRIKVMSTECLENGSCTKCGCRVPELQFASTPCEGECYPPFLSKVGWEGFKKGANFQTKNNKFSYKVGKLTKITKKVYRKRKFKNNVGKQ